MLQDEDFTCRRVRGSGQCHGVLTPGVWIVRLETFRTKFNWHLRPEGQKYSRSGENVWDHQKICKSFFITFFNKIIQLNFIFLIMSLKRGFIIQKTQDLILNMVAWFLNCLSGTFCSSYGTDNGSPQKVECFDSFVN